MKGVVKPSYEQLEKRLAEAERILDSLDPSGAGNWRAWLSWMNGNHNGNENLLEELERRVQKRTVDLVKANEALREEIAERKKTETALRQSEERFRSLFDNSPIAIVQLDLSRTRRYFRTFLEKKAVDLIKTLSTNETLIHQLIRSIRIMDANRACLTLHCAGSIEQYRAGFESSFAPETVLSLVRLLKHLSQGQALIKEETVIQGLDGKRRQVLIEVYTTAGTGGKWSRVVLHFIDLTELKRTERRLRRNEALLAEAQAIARLGSWEWTLSDNGIKWSDTLYEIFGVQKGSGIDYDFFLKCIPGDDREKVDSVAHRAIKNRENYSIDHRIVLPDGEERIIHESGVLRYDESGNPSRMVGTAQDITRLKQIEQNLIEERGKLQLMLKYLSLQAEVAAWLNSQNTIQDIIGLVLEKIARQLAVQAACFYRIEENSGDGISLFKSFLSESDYPLCSEAKIIGSSRYLLKRLRSGSFLNLSVHSAADRRIISRYFGGRDCSLLCCPLTVGGEVKGFICYGRRKPQAWDRTEEEVLGTLSGMIAGAWEREHHLLARLDAERKQTQAVRMAEQAVRVASIGVLAGGITHEINQPLNTMNLVVESLISDIDSGMDIKPWQFLEHLRAISNQIGRIGEIISHMRNFWVSPQQSDFRAFDLGEAVDNALALVRSQLQSHGVRLERISETRGLSLIGNRIHIEQITLNLVVNAMQALDLQSGQDKCIRVRSVRLEGRVVLEVEDNGPGFPEADADKLFDPFYSTRKPGQGTGLGLAIVRKFVEEFGGAISASLNPAGGATFRMEFPLLSTESEP